MTEIEAIEVLQSKLWATQNRYPFVSASEVEATKMSIEALQTQSKWIPVSERLPEKNVWVLVTVEQKIGERHQEIMRRNKYIDAWTDNIDNYTDEITAWMPLPEPYKAESEE